MALMLASGGGVGILLRKKVLVVLVPLVQEF